MATDNKYVKYASSMFERTSLEIIEISVWTAAFTWKEADEDYWGRVPKEDELLSAIRQKLITSAKDMERVGKRIHSTLGVQRLRARILHHWRTKIARVHQATAIKSYTLISSIATTRLFLQC